VASKPFFRQSSYLEALFIAADQDASFFSSLGIDEPFANWLVSFRLLAGAKGSQVIDALTHLHRLGLFNNFFHDFDEDGDEDGACIDSAESIVSKV